MEIDIVKQGIMIELVNDGSPALWDMRITKQFPDHGTFLLSTNALPLVCLERDLVNLKCIPSRYLNGSLE